MFTSNSTEETKKIAQTIIGNLFHKNIITLHGDLGAGKTTLTQFIAQHLNINQHIQSPTFTLFKTYNITGNTNFNELCHVDAYRLDENSNLDDLGITDYLNTPTTLTIIEWPERINNLLSQYSSQTQEISLELGEHEQQRHINIK